jgi:NADH-quinone oxidoreductase subunit J
MGAETAPASEVEVAALGSVAQIGRQLFGPFALPFEVASLVLLAAIVGAVVLARRRGT